MNDAAHTRFDPPADARAEMLADVRHGLAQSPKRLPSKYFYDARGSALFEQICEQPEYYLTRTELGLLDAESAAIAEAVGPGAMVVEFGSGSGIKTELLLAALQAPVAFVPIEISASALRGSLDQLQARFPDLELMPLCADFNQPLQLPVPQRRPQRVLIFFPGSTLGNFERAEAIELLRVMHADMGDDGAALVGIDLQKDPAVIEAAYNDTAGVTAAFTLNLLTRLNRELGADFDATQFAHRARYNAVLGRIETSLVSLRAQCVTVEGRQFAFAEQEAMQVEYSCKYAPADFAAMARAAGLRVSRTWTDADDRFALVMLQRAAPTG
jgi:dimethylhistidine N-methyltransferase